VGRERASDVPDSGHRLAELPSLHDIRDSSRMENIYTSDDEAALTNDQIRGVAISKLVASLLLLSLPIRKGAAPSVIG
jgi:hypothetical protein